MVRGSNRACMTPVRQQAFLLGLQKRLKAGPRAAAAVAAECDAVRRALCDALAPSKAASIPGVALKPRLRLAGNLEALAPDTRSASSLLAALANIVPGGGTATAAATGDASAAWTSALRTAEGKRPSGRGVVVGLASIENSCLLAAAPGLAWGHRDEASLAVAMEYLKALEGDFWVQLRGAGLTYGYSLYASKEQGLVCFNLSRCSDPARALAAAAAIVQKYASGATPFKATEFENAKSSLCSEQVGSWENKSGALGDTFQAWFYLAASAGPPTAEAYRRALMAQVQAVTPAQALAALQTYVSPLFDPGTRCFAVAAPLADHEAVARALGMKGPVAGLLLSSAEACNKVVAVKEKDLDALFPLGASGEASAAWPVGRQPFWRTHRSLTLAAAAVAVAVAAAAALRLARNRHR